MRRLVIHAGMHKTGTSFLQNTLYENREYLAEHGILYPESGLHRRSPNAGMRHLGLRMSLSEEGASSYALHALRDELRASNCETAIISYEGFLAPELDLTPLMAAFAEYELVMVVYLRNPLDYLESKYREWVRLNNYAGEIDRFYEFQQGFLDYTGLLDNATRLLGDDRIVVRSIDLIREHDQLVSDLLRSGGVTSRPIALPPTSRPNHRSDNSFSLTKLMANKLYFTGVFDARALVAREPYDYGSNEGRLMDDGLLERVHAREWPSFLRLLERHEQDPTNVQAVCAGEDWDHAFFETRVRDGAVRHVKALHERRLTSDAATRRHAEDSERRERETLRELRETQEQLTRVREDLVRASGQLQGAQAAERELRHLRRRIDLLRFWKVSNWRRYAGICRRRLERRRR